MIMHYRHQSGRRRCIWLRSHQRLSSAFGNQSLLFLCLFSNEHRGTFSCRRYHLRCPQMNTIPLPMVAIYLSTSHTREEGTEEGGMDAPEDSFKQPSPSEPQPTPGQCNLPACIYSYK
jgi:hypothetical protein